MGELILCSRPIAATPYFIDEAGLNIYSLEELSYYISRNVYSISHDFMTVDLCNFIGRELGMKELSSELLDMIEKGGTLHEFIAIILTSSGYLTTPEIKSTVSLIATFENKSEAECKKIRADRLMEQNRFVDAIYEYENILDDENIDGLNTQLLGDVWHNLGTAYARLFFFTEAAEAYRTAYENNHKIVSLKAMLCCFKCNHNDAGFDEAIKRYFVTADSVRQIEVLIEQVENSSEIRDFDNHINDLFVTKENGVDISSDIEEINLEWKKNYNAFCRI